MAGPKDARRLRAALRAPDEGIDLGQQDRKSKDQQSQI
jgi:hypothetical protein